MGLETATYISDLNASNPASGDVRSQGDDHLRMIKSVLQTTFPEASKAFRFPTVAAAQTANFAIVSPDDDNTVFPFSAAGGNRTITLPSSSLIDGFSFVVVRTDDTPANTLTLSAGVNINGATTLVLRRQYETVRVVYSSSAAQWFAETVNLPYLTPPTAKTSGFTLDAGMHGKLLRITPSAALTVTLPSTLPAGFKTRLVKTNSNAYRVTLDASSGGSVNGQNTLTFAKQYQLIELEFDGTTWWASIVALVGAVPPQGRLTLSSGVDVTTSDVTAATSIFYRAFTGNTVPIYSSALAAFLSQEMGSNELSLTLISGSHTANTAFDVFAALDPADGSTLIIGTGPAWSNSGAGTSARGSGAGTTELTLLKGFYVNANAITLRNGSTTYSISANEATFLGSFRTTGSAGQTEDSKTNRLLWNLYNYRRRPVNKQETTSSWTYSVASWRQVNGASGNQVNFFCGLLRDNVSLQCNATANADNSAIHATGIGVNSTSANSATMTGGSGMIAQWITMTSRFDGFPALGYNNFNWLEYSSAASTTTWYGTGGGQAANGISGTVIA